jgi:hypothetical protein
MEMHKENSVEKRRRKVIQKEPVLIRSVKPSQNSNTLYERENGSTSNSIWKN